MRGRAPGSQGAVPELAREVVLHTLIAALMAEAMLRLWGAATPLKMRLRLFVLTVPCLVSPAILALAPFRHQEEFLEGWTVFSGARWGVVKVLGAGIDQLWLATFACIGMALLGMDLVPWLRERSTGPSATLPCPQPVRATVARLAQGLGIPCPEVELVEAPAALLFCRGVRHPRVVLSTTTLAHLDARELEGALAHELAHLAAGDVLLGWVLLGVRVVQAINPVVQVLARAIALDAEERADARAARLTGRPAALAAALISMFKVSRGQRPTSEVLLGAALTRALEAPIVTRGRLLLRPPEAEERGVDAVRLLAGAVVIPAVLFFVT
jgi:Zn-dependent protease with chaperone function